MREMRSSCSPGSGQQSDHRLSVSPSLARPAAGCSLPALPGRYLGHRTVALHHGDLALGHFESRDLLAQRHPEARAEHPKHVVRRGHLHAEPPGCCVTVSAMLPRLRLSRGCCWSAGDHSATPWSERSTTVPLWSSVWPVRSMSDRGAASLDARADHSGLHHPTHQQCQSDCQQCSEPSRR